MRTQYVETYRLGSYWWAETPQASPPFRATGETESAALAELCDRLYEECVYGGPIWPRED